MDQRKFYCEVCRVLIPYNHKDITAHERSQKHKKNKDRTLQDANRKSKKEKEKTQPFRSNYTPKQKEEAISMMNEINKRAFQQYETDCHQFGQSSNPELKPEEIPNTIELPLDQDPEKTENLFGDVWSLRVDTDTGKLCFYNKISGKIQFQKPVGLKLTAKEKEIWETQNNNPESNDGLFGPAISKLALAGNIGQWEEVNPEEDYYEKNAYASGEDNSSDDLEPGLQKIERKLDKSAEKLQNQEEKNENKNDKLPIIINTKPEEKDVIDELLEYKDQTNFGKSVLKLKNERLIKLAEENFELGVFEKPIYQKISKTNDGDEGVKNTTFKKRKNNNSKAILIQPDDSP